MKRFFIKSDVNFINVLDQCLLQFYYCLPPLMEGRNDRLGTYYWSLTMV